MNKPTVPQPDPAALGRQQLQVRDALLGTFRTVASVGVIAPGERLLQAVFGQDPPQPVASRFPEGPGFRGPPARPAGVDPLARLRVELGDPGDRAVVLALGHVEDHHRDLAQVLDSQLHIPFDDLEVGDQGAVLLPGPPQHGLFIAELGAANQGNGQFLGRDPPQHRERALDQFPVRLGPHRHPVADRHRVGRLYVAHVRYIVLRIGQRPAADVEFDRHGRRGDRSSARTDSVPV